MLGGFEPLAIILGPHSASVR